MTKELEPCPFCPEGVLPVRLKKDGKPTGIVAHACYALGREIRVPEHVWNTRYKRTCHIVDIAERRESGGVHQFYHLSCGHFIEKKLGERFYFCEQCGAALCGAEVADGD